MYKLSPSDFKYLYEDCKHCYWQKVKHGIGLPSIGMPGVFSKMNALLQNAIIGMDLREINASLPAGKIQVKEGFLKSKPIPRSNSCFISGRFDIASELDDGSFAVIDFKITDPTEEKIQKFFPQLHAYKFALEHPGYGEPKHVSRMGVIAINPEKISFPGENVVFSAKPLFFEIEEDMERFYAFIDEVAKLLNGPVPPENPDACKWCKYRHVGEKLSRSEPQDIPF